MVLVVIMDTVETHEPNVFRGKTFGWCQVFLEISKYVYTYRYATSGTMVSIGSHLV